MSMYSRAFQKNFRIRSMSTTSKAGPTLASKPLWTPELHVAFSTYSVRDGVVSSLPSNPLGFCPQLFDGVALALKFGKKFAEVSSVPCLFSTTDSSAEKSGCADSSFSVSFFFIPSSEKKLILHTVACRLTRVASALLKAGFESNALSLDFVIEKSTLPLSVPHYWCVQAPGLTFMLCAFSASRPLTVWLEF